MGISYDAYDAMLTGIQHDHLMKAKEVAAKTNLSQTYAEELVKTYGKKVGRIHTLSESELIKLDSAGIITEWQERYKVNHGKNAPK